MFEVSSEIIIPSNTELLAKNLSEYIKLFVKSDTPKRERLLAGFCEYLLNDKNRVVDEEVLRKLTLGNEEALSNTVKQELSSDQTLWSGSATVVCLTEDGEVWGIFSQRPQQEILEKEYGNKEFNFYRVALMKALVSFHLDKAGKIGDSGDHAENYLWKIGYPKTKHAGFTEKPAVINRKKVYFGGSGCEANENVIKQIPDLNNEGHFRLAGFFDKMFVNNVAGRISNPNFKPAPFNAINIQAKVLNNTFYD